MRSRDRPRYGDRTSGRTSAGIPPLCPLSARLLPRDSPDQAPLPRPFELAPLPVLVPGRPLPFLLRLRRRAPPVPCEVSLIVRPAPPCQTQARDHGATEPTSDRAAPVRAGADRQPSAPSPGARHHACTATATPGDSAFPPSHRQATNRPTPRLAGFRSFALSPPSIRTETWQRLLACPVAGARLPGQRRGFQRLERLPDPERAPAAAPLGLVGGCARASRAQACAAPSPGGTGRCGRLGRKRGPAQVRVADARRPCARSAPASKGSRRRRSNRPSGSSA